MVEAIFVILLILLVILTTIMDSQLVTLLILWHVLSTTLVKEVQFGAPFILSIGTPRAGHRHHHHRRNANRSHFLGQGTH